MAAIRVLYRRNLNMTPGKLAAQAIHAALALEQDQVTYDMSVIVLGASDLKFEEAKATLKRQGVVVIQDAGLTELAKGTETCLAWIDKEEGQNGR